MNRIESNQNASHLLSHIQFENHMLRRTNEPIELADKCYWMEWCKLNSSNFYARHQMHLTNRKRATRKQADGKLPLIAIYYMNIALKEQINLVCKMWRRKMGRMCENSRCIFVFFFAAARSKNNLNKTGTPHE